METTQVKTKYRPWKLGSLQPQHYDVIHVSRRLDRYSNWKLAAILLTRCNIVILFCHLSQPQDVTAAG